MRRGPFLLILAVVGVMLGVRALAAPFVVFPQAGALASPDGRFVVRNEDRIAPASDFNGNFHSLKLFDSATGRSRKLCDYLGVVAVAWAKNNLLVVNEYVARKTSRAWVFSASAPEDVVMLDKSTLTRMAPPELRAALRENDHVFVEASGIEGDTLHLSVWGYGRHDVNGFRWRCAYTMLEGTVSCAEQPGSQ
jgi:hypothetical protein